MNNIVWVVWTVHPSFPLAGFKVGVGVDCTVEFLSKGIVDGLIYLYVAAKVEKIIFNAVRHGKRIFQFGENKQRAGLPARCFMESYSII